MEKCKDCPQGKKIIEEIKKREEKGLPLNYSYTKKDVGYLVEAAIRYFGKWENAINKVRDNFSY